MTMSDREVIVGPWINKDWGSFQVFEEPRTFVGRNNDPTQVDHPSTYHSYTSTCTHSEDTVSRQDYSVDRTSVILTPVISGRWRRPLNGSRGGPSWKRPRGRDRTHILHTILVILTSGGVGKRERGYYVRGNTMDIYILWKRKLEALFFSGEKWRKVWYIHKLPGNSSRSVGFPTRGRLRNQIKRN